MLSSTDLVPGFAGGQNSSAASDAGAGGRATRVSGPAGGLLLSTVAASGPERKLALGMVAVSAIFFLAAVPFAKVQLAAVPAFIPLYQSALVVCDLLTAALLLAQFGILRLRALLILASAYLFSACIAVSHTLSFPGLFAPGGLLGAGPQTTAWLYMFWHGGFALLVVGYAALKDKPLLAGRGAALLATAGVLAAVCAFTLLTTAGAGLLPAVMQGNGYTPALLFVVSTVWGLSALALGVLWLRRPHSALDLWLMVVMCAWLFDIGLAAVFNHGRFDLGFYAGRIYGLLAATFVLVMLLVENTRLYAQLITAHEGARRSLARHAERLRVLHGIDQAMIAGESPESIAAAAIQPLRELLGVPRAIVNRFELATGEVEWLAAAGRRRVHVGPGVRYPIRMIGDLAALKRGETQIVDTRTLPQSAETQALLESGVDLYMVVPMIAGGELLGAISFGGKSADFSDEQVQVAKEIAAQIAIAKAMSRLIAQGKRHAAELETKVMERTAELEAVNKELASFSYSVSHDLRAPLRAIDGYGRMLEEDYAARLDDEGRRLLGVVRDNSRQMGRLIDDLLEFSRLGRQTPAKQRFDMTALAREVADQATQGTRAKVELAALPPSAADRALLKQVWVNLIGNAVKYSGKRDQPRVEIGAHAEGDEIVYWVRDNGAGFDPRYAAKLFGVFQRLHGQDEFPGTGVGLAIVQRVVARHGGRVWAEGKAGEGACFFFSLPAGD